MKKVFVMLIILMMLIVVITACSSSSDIPKSVENDTTMNVSAANDDGLDSALNELDDLERLEKE